MSSPEPMRLPDLIEEAKRQIAICNACRYCEGYCAVFPALQRRLEFAEHDVHYLANLCHNCGSCLHACQYAPPHAFDLNFPRTLAQVRAVTYAKYAWPGPLARLFARGGTVASLAAAGGFAFLLVLLVAMAGPGRLFAAHPDAAGSFYALLPHGTMAWLFGGVFAFSALAIAIGLARFWPDMGESLAGFLSRGPLAEASSDALRLKYLDGSGDACSPPEEAPSHARRIFHHATFYGFLLCFAATAVATVYHYALGRPAPYPFLSLPVLLGTVGGVGLLVGPAGLWWVKRRRAPELGDAAQRGLDEGFLALLFLTSLTGLLLLVLRESRAMGLVLAAHLGVVLALFLTMPYGKFVHGFYRFAALARFHLERRRPAASVGTE